MKCDKLEKMYAGQFSPSAVVYGALYVDEAIAELKTEIEKIGKDMKIIEKVVAAKLRSSRRALFLARTEWARSAALSYHLLEDHPDKDAAATYRRKANKWEKVQKACAKYAEKIKG